MYGLYRCVQRLGMLRQQAYRLNAAVLLLFTIENMGLAQHGSAIFKGGLQLDVFIGHRKHPPRDGQHLAETRHRLIKAGHNVVQRRQQQIAQTLTCQRAVGEPVGHQLSHQRLAVGQRLQAAADIAGSGHTQVLPQHTGAAAVVRHGDDGGDIPGIELQTPQQRAQSRAAADAHDLRPLFRGDMI